MGPQLPHGARPDPVPAADHLNRLERTGAAADEHDALTNGTDEHHYFSAPSQPSVVHERNVTEPPAKKPGHLQPIGGSRVRWHAAHLRDRRFCCG